MDILSKLLISIILILSILNRIQINSSIVSISMLLIVVISYKFPNTNYPLLFTFILLLVISNNPFIEKFTTTNQMDDETTQSKYCIPAKNGVCRSPFNNSINDPNWCCIGNGYCNQPCPPTNCQRKSTWGACPSKGQVQSADNPDMCCYGEGCKCSTDPNCPKATTCGYTPPEEEEEEAIDPNICPCDTSLECTKKIREIKRSGYTRQMYSSPPLNTTPDICKDYINKNNNRSRVNNAASTAINNTTYNRKVKIPSNYTPSSSLFRKTPFNQYIN